LTDQNIEIIAIIPTHWHDDCLGGLKAFHDHNIPSYALDKTCTLAQKHHYSKPQFAFTDSLQLSLGNEKIHSYFYGGGHTTDNIVVWFPSDQILFGGCLVKSLSSRGLGFTGDADLEAWPQTITTVMKKRGNAMWVIPGHGQPGDKELLEHTLKLLNQSE
jgi:metallo-beta-lactamase class B